MAGKNTAAFGIYSTRADVERAVDALRSDGFRNTDISVLYPLNEGSKDLAHIVTLPFSRARDASNGQNSPPA